MAENRANPDVSIEASLERLERLRGSWKARPSTLGLRALDGSSHRSLMITVLARHAVTLNDAVMTLTRDRMFVPVVPLVRGILEAAVTAAWMVITPHSLEAMVEEQARQRTALGKEADRLARSIGLDDLDQGPSDAEAELIGRWRRFRSDAAQSFEQRCLALANAPWLYADYRWLSQFVHPGTALLDVYVRQIESSEAPVGNQVSVEPAEFGQTGFVLEIQVLALHLALTAADAVSEGSPSVLCSRRSAMCLVSPGTCTQVTSNWGGSLACLTRETSVGVTDQGVGVEHVKYDLGQLKRGSTVVVTLNKQANVLLLDRSNYSSYVSGRQHRYFGGLMTRSPARIPVPSDGHWFIAVDLGGGSGTIRSGVSVEPPPRGNLPRYRQAPERSLLDALDVRTPNRPVDPEALDGRTWDVFISHASEDKSAVAIPLAEALHQRGVSAWLDKAELRIGESLRRRIDQGLAASRFAVVILSPAYFAKGWPQYELDGIVTLTVSGKQSMLPVWHDLGWAEVAAKSPSLADKLARSTADTDINIIADEIAELVSSRR